VSELVADSNDSFFRPLGSDSDTLDGLNVHGALLDEIHAWKTKDLYDVIVDGVTALSGVTFNYPILASFGVSMQIRDDFSAYSGANYLGTNDGGAFLGGDIFNLSFAYASAVGMFFLTGDQLLDGDISLTVGTTVASLSSTYETTLSDGSFVYFLGIVDRENQFNSAEVSSLGGGLFEFNVDNIITAVPSPSVLSLLLIGLAPMLCGFKIKHN
jgi:hypothetical protein